jgi:hypothetical protein
MWVWCGKNKDNKPINWNDGSGINAKRKSLIAHIVALE